ncbi:hypothetical protein WR25_25816 [Diploscapter pachys]|uniref:CUB domain-containing protein n=1 Tax=Diploscapter pachys TaxID=2018661 RepID=A0A2A2KCY7_9BILA|nr:hypothetical protein WR25_25816 [Diploscapter pachys]
MLIPYFLLISSFPIILGKHENLAERNFLRGDSHDSLENRQAVKNILKNIKLNEQEQRNAKKMHDMPIIQKSPNPIPAPVKNETKGLQKLNAEVADLLFQTDMALNIEQAKAIAGGDRCEELAQGDAQGCSGKTIDATETERNFTIAIRDSTNYDVREPAQNCYWIIRAPEGKKVTMSLSLDSIACVKQCPWRGIEINTGRFDLVGFRMTNGVFSVSDSSKSIKLSTPVPLSQMMDSVGSAPAASSAAVDEPEPVEHVYQMYISARPKRGTRRVNFASNSSGDSSVQISMPFCSYFMPPSKFPDLVPLSSSEYYFVGSTDGQNDRRRRVRRSKASTVAMTGLRGTIQKKFPVHRSSRIEAYGPKRPNGEERRNERRKKNGKRKKTAVEQIDNEERRDIKIVAEEYEMDQEYQIPTGVRFFRD